MPVIDADAHEINYKIVYYGCGLSGKTTNIQYIHRKINPRARGKLVSIPTEEERTLYFDFLSLELGAVKGMQTHLHLYTVPGQSYYNASRKLVLQGVDGIVFVADSQITRLDDNIESYLNLWDNVMEHGDAAEARLRDADEQARPERHLRSAGSQRLAQPHRLARGGGLRGIRHRRVRDPQARLQADHRQQRLRSPLPHPALPLPLGPRRLSRADPLDPVRRLVDRHEGVPEQHGAILPHGAHDLHAPPRPARLPLDDARRKTAVVDHARMILARVRRPDVVEGRGREADRPAGLAYYHYRKDAVAGPASDHQRSTGVVPELEVRAAPGDGSVAPDGIVVDVQACGHGARQRVARRRRPH